MLFIKLIVVIFIFDLSFNSSKSTLKNKYNMNNINKFRDNFMHIICFSIIWFVKMNIIFQFSTNNDIQLMIQLNFFFFKNYKSISYDLSLKKFLWCSCSTILQFYLFQFFTLCAFVQWKVLKWFLLICSIKFLFVQWIINYDVSSNTTIFCWLLIQKFCLLCLIKQFNIMFSQHYNCFYQIYAESLCFFLIYFEIIFLINACLKKWWQHVD